MSSNTYQPEYFNSSAASIAAATNNPNNFYQYFDNKHLPAIYVPGQSGSSASKPANQSSPLQQAPQPQGSSSLPPASSISGNYPPSTDYSYSYYYNNGVNSGNPVSSQTSSAASSSRMLPMGYYPSNSSGMNNYNGNATTAQGYQGSNIHSMSYSYPNYVTSTSPGNVVGAGGAGGVAPPIGYSGPTKRNGDSTSQSPSQKYPVSPQNLGIESSESEAYPPFQNAQSGAIDYSSLVSYTISPSLKRKRRKAKSLSDASGAGGLDPNAAKNAFSCQVCHKVFQKQYNLKSHMKIHFSEKPYQCAKCPKRFARSHDKKRHELLHEGVKNFKCEGYLKDGVTKWGCGKKFARSDALSRHFRTETGWLCIRPLMEESKHLDSKDVGMMQHSQHLQQPQAQADLHQQAGSMVEPERSSDGSYIYNSSMIRRLIQSK